MLKLAAGMAKLGAAAAVALGAQLVVVLGALAWMAASVGITDSRWWCGRLCDADAAVRDVVGRLVDRRERGRARVALRAVAGAGVAGVGDVGVQSAARGRVWKPFVLRARRLHGRRDRIDAHAHPLT